MQQQVTQKNQNVLKQGSPLSVFQVISLILLIKNLERHS